MKPSIQLVRESFEYNPDTGILIWRHRPREHFKTLQAMLGANTKNQRLEAGIIHTVLKGNKKYRRVHFRYKHIYSHHIIWAIKKGVWPESLDHKDGNGLNNKWDNIKKADSQENNKNLKLYKTNKSGVSGVYKRGCSWVAHIGSSKNAVWLGSFPSKSEAINARKKAEELYGYSPRHGENRPSY